MKKAKKISALLIAFMLIVSCFSGLSISASASSATKTVWFDPGKASDGSPVWFAWTWDGVTDSWSQGTESGNYITFDNIGNKMIIVRMPKGSTKGDWDTCWNRTDTIDVSESNLVTFKAWGSNNYFTVTTGTYAGGEVPSSAAPDPEPTTRPAAAGGATADDYYLCGYINGANYGVEKDYETLGEYYFKNGTLTTSFSGVTWVGVKTGDNKNWYFYDGEEGCTETSAVLTKDAPEKMFIPAGVEVTLTLTVNKDDTVTLSYETGETIPTQPTEPYTGEGTKGDYYLCGYINGENYGVEEDYENLGDFHFVGGKLTTTFTAVTWVGVKTADNKKWYFYDGEVGCTETTAILTKDAPEKMFIPADVEVTLTLEENADGTLTLSYTTGGDEPTTNEPEETTAPVTEAPEIITPGFYIIGSKEVCGAEWSFEPWKYGVPMTQLGDSNIFTQTFTNVASSANAYDSTGAHRYEFKVVHVSEKGGITWHPGGMGNSTFVTVADNDSTLTFTFKLLAASPTTEGQYPEAVVCEVKSPFEPSTQAPTTQAPTTQAPTTQAPTTQAPTTQAPVTEAPTTQAPTTQAPVTEAPTTQAPTTQAPVTEAPTTQAPTTQAPVTEAP